MPLVISDDILKSAGPTEREAAIEIACRLFNVGRLPLWSAAQLAGLSRAEMEDALAAREIPVYRFTPEEYGKDRATMRKLWGNR